MADDTPPSQNTPDGSSYETWEQARKYSSLVGNVSSLFSTAIRFLRKDAESPSKALSQTSKFCLQRLLNSDSFKAPVYYAALTFKPDAVKEATYLSPVGLASLFTPDELAHLIGSLYLYRRIQKGCDENEWSELSRNMHLHAELAGHVGVAMPNISLGWGMLLGSIRHLSCGLFLGVDQKKYVQYRRNQKIKKQTFDLTEEITTFGCSHLHIASLLVQSLGLGSAIPKAINTGLLTSTSDDSVDADGYRMRIAWVWTEALKATGQPSNITHKGAYYPKKQELEVLLARAAQLKEEGSRWLFLKKGKEDISPEKTPCLFQAAGPGAGAKPAAAEAVEAVEKEVLDQFSTTSVESEEI